MPEIRRLRLPDFLMSMWLPVAFRRMTLPVPDSRNRLAAPRCVRILGIALPILSTRPAAGRGRSLLLARRPFDGGEHHGHVPSVEQREGLYGSKFLQVSGQPVQQS